MTDVGHGRNRKAGTEGRGNGAKVFSVMERSTTTKTTVESMSQSNDLPCHLISADLIFVAKCARVPGFFAEPLFGVNAGFYRNSARSCAIHQRGSRLRALIFRHLFCVGCKITNKTCSQKKPRRISGKILRSHLVIFIAKRANVGTEQGLEKPARNKEGWPSHIMSCSQSIDRVVKFIFYRPYYNTTT